MKMVLKFSLFYIFVIINIIAGRVEVPCQPNEDILYGACKLVTKCDFALKLIKETRRHPFRRCGFKGDLEVICCPLRTSDMIDDTNDPIESSRDLIPTTGKNQFHYGEEEQSPPNTDTATKERQRIADIECAKIVESSIPPLGLHITGGEMANVGEFPHMVALGYNRTTGYEFLCGGSLISKTFVLTAAHCVDNLDRAVPSMVRTGVAEIGSGEWNSDTDVRVTEIIKHPDYSRSTKYHDLTLLRLERPIEDSNNPKPICLYTGDDDPNIPLTITGWGTTDPTRNLKSSVLMKANVSFVPRNICKESYKNWRKLPREITEEQICAGDSKGIQDACQGDSGGPLQGMPSRDGNYRLFGVTSFGKGCGSTEPGVYVRVAKYLDWIESVVWPNS